MPHLQEDGAGRQALRTSRSRLSCILYLNVEFPAAGAHDLF